MKNTSVAVICEGRSEYAYIQELNRILTRGFSSAFIPCNAQSGIFANIKRCFTYVQKNNPRTPIVIWVDKDIYLREERQRSAYSQRKGIPEFYFSVMNFEDFLVMHLDSLEIQRWEQVCARANHFSVPMKEVQYEPLFREHIFQDYRKGELPFEINRSRLEQLFNNLDVFSNFDCEFIKFVRQEIEEGKLEFL